MTLGQDDKLHAKSCHRHEGHVTQGHELCACAFVTGLCLFRNFVLHARISKLFGKNDHHDNVICQMQVPYHARILCAWAID